MVLVFLYLGFIGTSNRSLVFGMSFSTKKWLFASAFLFPVIILHCGKQKIGGIDLAAEKHNITLPDTADIPANKTGDEIRYGRELFCNTAIYLGPEGKVMQLSSNKMDCKNCHLDGGTRPYSNNLLETYLKYPQYRAREGKVLTIEDRINNCFERPMNGKMLPYDSREMRALVAYIRWLCEGKVVSYNEDTMHLGNISFPNRAANIKKGEVIFASKCATCHGMDGQGQMNSSNTAYDYPPLWGMQSYAQGSSMHRIITAARFIKWSMPYSATITKPQLSDEEAFDVAAFINCDSIHPRPYRPLKNECPDLENKPIDFPSGPFLDSFPERQHKYGPFGPIKKFYDTYKNK